MISFFSAIIILIVGYFVYGKIVERIFGIDDSLTTPAIEMQDGVDYVPMDWKKIFLIQFLNIAGLGPIFGAIQGALFGPAAFLWIVFGTIFAGGVHDFLSGYLSLKNKGVSASELVGIYLGETSRKVMVVFSVVLLVLVGVVFVTGPAGLLNNLTNINTQIWVVVIFAYYILATVLPVDTVIGKIYPIFGAALILMAVGIGAGLIFEGYHIPELSFRNFYPDGAKSIFPYLFITIACGAISGFHATQSPLMARCIEHEREIRPVFYGAMVAEGIIALIWAAAAMAFYNYQPQLQAVYEATPAVGVNQMSITLLGRVGSVLAIIGVVACPITSGDTAFRSARLTIADSFNMNQESLVSRFKIAIPLFAVGIALTFIDFQIIWRYFSWANQTLAMIMLWTGSMFLLKNKKNYMITFAPAIFMTAVTFSYIMQAPEGFRLPAKIGNIIGVIVAVVFAIMFFIKESKLKKGKNKK